MKKLILSILLLASCATPTQTREPTFASNTLIVGNEAGGFTSTYRRLAETLVANPRPIALTGECASACTLLLQTKYNLDICATSSATLHFHMPYWTDPTNNRRMYRGGEYTQRSLKIWKEEWLNSFSPELNAILLDATRRGRIPNPSRNGDDRTTFFIAANRVVKGC